MTAKERKLQQQAVQYTDHDMGPFVRDEYWTKLTTSTCRQCGAYVTVNTRPAPNQIDISGSIFGKKCTK